MAREAPADSEAAAQLPLRRLSALEYRHTLTDLFGADAATFASFAEDVGGATGQPEGSLISAAALERMYISVDDLTRMLVDTRLSELAPCATNNTDPSTCGVSVIATWGRRIFRRPPSSEETSQLQALYEAERSVSTKDGVRVLLTAMLLSPRFHYRWELHENAPTVVDGGEIALSSYELASRLAYYLWQSTPDDTLLDLAESDALRQPEVLQAQAERLLADPVKGPRGIRALFFTWLGLNNLRPSEEAAETALDPQTAEALLEETGLFVDSLMASTEPTLRRLLTNPETFINRINAPLYGLEGEFGAAFQRVAVNAGERAGILTQPSFLAASYSSPLATPIRRGRFLYQQLVACRSVPPPEGEIPEPPHAEANMSVRQQLSAHTENGVCASCHQFMDPLGFPFLGYDRTGRARLVDDYGQPIDASGSLQVGSVGTVSYTNAVELAAAVAELRETSECVARQFLLYGLRQDPKAGRHLQSVREAFKSSDNNLRSLILAVTRTRAFFYRTPASDEVQQ